MCKKLGGCEFIIRSRIDNFSTNSKNVSYFKGSLFALYYFGMVKKSCKGYYLDGKYFQLSSINGIKSESTTATIFE